MRQPLYVALTFDDGYLEHADIARVLHRLHVRATFFLVTGLEKWNGRPLLTLQPERIREMSDCGHEIGSHTVSHANLPTLANDEIHEELRKSKGYLENLLGKKIAGFAYPYGVYDYRVKNIVAKYYEYARSASDDPPSRDNVYELLIRSPGRSFAHCSLLMTRMMIEGSSFVTILLHSVPARSIRLWTMYLKLFRVNFVTLSELVDARFNQANARISAGS
jgi:hypothetical protein